MFFYFLSLIPLSKTEPARNSKKTDPIQMLSGDTNILLHCRCHHHISHLYLIPYNQSPSSLILLPFHSMETASFLSRSAVPISRPSPLLQTKKRGLLFAVCALENKNPNPNIKSISIGSSKKKKVPVSNYVVPLDTVTSASSCITRPLAEILRDLNKRVPDNTIKPQSNSLIPWFVFHLFLPLFVDWNWIAFP